jgi:ABC-type transporter MlaC component
MSYFGELVRQDFDLAGISGFVLGPYWRVASPAQRQEFAN